MCFGRNCGKDINKFEKTGLHLQKCESEGFGELIIEECLAAFEMSVEKLIPFEDGGYMIVGKVEVCHAREEFFKDGKFLYNEKTDINDLPLHHLGGDKYGVICLN